MLAPLHGPGLKEEYEIKKLRHKVNMTPSYDAKSETEKLLGTSMLTTNLDTNLLKKAARELQQHWTASKSLQDLQYLEL